MLLKARYLLLSLFVCLPVITFAQKAERDNIRRGNRQFKDSAFVDAEVNYRRALDVNPTSSVSMYNLGNALFAQNKKKDALEQYAHAATLEKNPEKLAQIYHNMGVALQDEKNYGKALEAYRNALLNNPKDNESRYNYALVKKLLKEQQQNQNQKQDQQQKDQKQDKQEQKQNQNQNNDKQEQKQNPPQNDKKNEMSKENADQLLQSVMQDEKDTQEKVKKQMQQVQSGRLEKDW